MWDKIKSKIADNLEDIGDSIEEAADVSADYAIDKLTSAAKQVSKRLLEQGLKDCNVSVGTEIFGISVGIEGPIAMFMELDHCEHEEESDE